MRLALKPCRRGVKVLSHRLSLFCSSTLTACFLLAPVSLRAEPKLDNLLVYGQGFFFSVKEPTGWHGDTKNAAQYSANIIFYPKADSPNDAPVLIRVTIVDKTDEDIEKDLAADMNEYRLRYPAAVFKSLPVAHPVYQVVSRIFTVPQQFFEYVSYVNPGPNKKLMFSVAMNKQHLAGTEAEMTAYRAVVASLAML